MAAFQRGNDAFEAGQLHEGAQRLLVGRVAVFHTAGIVQPGVFGADRSVVQARADAVGELDLPHGVLEDVAARALQHTERTAVETRRVLFR